ncbi:hypothetical protein FUAX_22020 [Fulvitalea axinellae]|uniref:Outer membrane protein SusF/SusE-like C-terminal domain-containing protein n=1 Tax=Fulvitalea axinellae TaxID=1182444 RepID=A0AAU9CKE3_9BACT|nr:hypothetical protein FUAX_22020 [Fulvitalea axinellae]
MKKLNLLGIYLLSSLAFTACDVDPYVEFSGEKPADVPADVTTPGTEITVPTDIMYYGGDKISVSVKLTDEVNLKEANVKVFLPGSKVALTRVEELNGTEKTLAYEIDNDFLPNLESGLAKVQVSVKDASGNFKNSSKTFAVERPAIETMYAVISGDPEKVVEMTKSEDNEDAWTLKEEIPVNAEVMFSEKEDKSGFVWGFVSEGEGFRGDVKSSDAFEVKNEKAGLYSFEFNVKDFGLIAKDASFPETLYLVGGSTLADWSPEKSLAFNKVTDGVFEIQTPLTVSGHGFKFLPTQAWDGDWGQKKGADKGVLEQDDEENVTVEKDGYYLVKVDYPNGKYTVTQLKYGVVGSATPGDWSTDTEMTYLGEGKFTLDVTLKVGEMKFRANNDWAYNYGDNGADGTPEPDGKNLNITEAGEYTVTLSIGTEGVEYSLTKK